MFKKIACLRNWYYIEMGRCPWLAQEILHFLQGNVIVSLVSDSIPYPWAQKINKLELTSVFYVLYHIILFIVEVW
jgi:cytochrome bd-type quinol oxidase subunit 1